MQRVGPAVQLVQPTCAGAGLIWVADAAGGSGEELGLKAAPCGGGAWG